MWYIQKVKIVHPKNQASALIPIPEHHFNVWSMDFISGLPFCTRFNITYTCINKLSRFIHFVHCFKVKGNFTSPKRANIFFTYMVCLFGLCTVIFYNCDLHFTSNFWCALWDLFGTNAFLTSAYHPQTDGHVEHIHYTIENLIQCLLVVRHDNWLAFSPFVEFSIYISV